MSRTTIRCFIPIAAAMFTVAGCAGAMSVSLTGCSSQDDRTDPTSNEEVRANQIEALHEILVVEDHRLLNDPKIVQGLASKDVVIVRRALLAVGRIQDTARAADVVAMLDHPRAEVRGDAAFSLALLKSDGASAAVRARLAKETAATAKVGLAFAAGRLCDASCFGLLASLLEPSEPATVQEAGAEALAAVFYGLDRAAKQGPQPPPPPAATLPAGDVARLVALIGQAPTSRAIAAAQALRLLPGKGSQIEEGPILAAFGAADDSTLRNLLASILAKTASPAAVKKLIDAALHDPAATVRAEATAGLGKVTASALVLDTLMSTLHDPVGQVAVAGLQSLAALGKGAADRATQVGEFLSQTRSTWLQAEGLAAILALNPTLGRARLDDALKSPNWHLRYAAVDQLQILGTDPDVLRLDTMLDDSDARVVAEAISALSSFDAPRVPASSRAKVAHAVAGHDIAVVEIASPMIAKLGWAENGPELEKVYALHRDAGHTTIRAAIVTAIGDLGLKARLPFIQGALDDDDHGVVEAAAAAFKKLTGKDPPTGLRSQNRVTEATPPRAEIARALEKTVVLQTSRGQIEIAMRKDQPLAAQAFVARVESGFYNGLDVHRVIPNFVAQGGDPHADGWGGSLDAERDAFTMSRHTRGSLAVAAAGRDTGGSQFFFNLTWNQGLDAEFAVFADVTSGLDVMDRLEVGDVIVRASAR